MTKTLNALLPALVLTALVTSGCYVTSAPPAVAPPRPWPAAHGRVPAHRDDGRHGPHPDGGTIGGHWEAGGRVRVSGHWE
jgi:hypothetical protein